MSPGSDHSRNGETGVIHVHYWAAARAAAGVGGDDLAVAGPLSLAEVRSRAAALHPGTRLAQVLASCSTLIGEQPVASADPDQVLVPVGESVEFLPPFAGG